MSSSFIVPESVKRFNLQARGPAGADWLARLPGILAACAEQWDLRVGPPFEPLSINYVTAAVGGDGSALVLKLSFIDDEFYSEAGALELYNGRASVRLLELDRERGAMLLERVLPGAALASIERMPENETTVTAAAAELMQRLWRPEPVAPHPFPSFALWMEHMRARSPLVLRREPRFPVEQIRRALALHAALNDPSAKQVLLHGDLHHGNILSSTRSGWLAIDPKGVVGPPVAETGPLLLNALPSDLNLPETRQILASRSAQLAEALGIQRDLLRAWAVVRAILSAYWCVEGGGRGWEWGLRIAQILSEEI